MSLVFSLLCEFFLSKANPWSISESRGWNLWRMIIFVCFFLLNFPAIHAQANAFLVASGTALMSSRVWRQIIGLCLCFFLVFWSWIQQKRIWFLIWYQTGTVADCIGRELLMEETAVEATSRGVAISLGVALKLHSFEEAGELAQSTVSTSKPQVAAHMAYLEARHQQEFLYRKLFAER
jgi:hypothetical protein